MNPTFFIDDATVVIRAAEVPLADFDAACNLAGSCASGVGIGIGTTNLTGVNRQFTINDQRGNPRTPQTSQHLGGNALGDGTSGTLPDGTIRSGVVSVSGDGQIPDPQENVSLIDLVTGWQAP